MNIKGLGKRVAYYGLGLALGTILVFFIFGGRKDIRCSYFPNQRVTNDFAQKEVRMSDLAACQRDCLALDSLDVKQFFAAGDVDFSASEPRKKPYGYYKISTELPENRIVTATIENQDSVVVFLDIRQEGRSCPCDE